MPTDITSVLDKTGAPKEVKAQAWDAFQKSKSPDEFKQNFDKILIPKETKAALWDQKFSGGSTVNELTLSGMKKRGPTPMEGMSPLGRGATAYADTVGIPTSSKDAREMIKGFPLNVAAGLESKMGALENKLGARRAEAIKNKDFGELAKTDAEFFIRGPGSLVGGEGLWNTAKGLLEKDYPLAVGSGLGVITLGLLMKGKPEDYRTNKLTYATKADPLDIKAVMGDLDRHAQKKLFDVKKINGKDVPTKTFYQSGRTVGDLHDLVKENSRQYNNEFGQALQPIAGQKVVPTPIADAIRNQITPEMQQTAEGRQMMTQLGKRAVEYDKPWTIQQLDLQRTKATRRLRSYRNAAPSGARAASALDVDTMVNKAVEDGTKDIVYSALDKANNKPAGYFEGLKRRQSANMSLSDQLVETTEKLRKATAEKAGAPFLKKHGLHFYGHPESGRIGTSMHALQDIGTSPEKSASRAVKKAFPKNSMTTKKALVYSYPMRTLMLPSHTNTLPPLNDGTDSSQ